MKKLVTAMAFVLATSIYLFLASFVCYFCYCYMGLSSVFGVNMHLGHWLAITIIIKTLFIDSQLIFANKNRKDDK